MKNFLLIFIAVTSLFLSSCTEKQEEKKPNFVWLLSEDNSKHYIKLFDEDGIATPNIEKMAENGLVFTHAFSNAAVCSAARSTLVSGCYGPRVVSHFHRRNKKVTMPDGVNMFPQYLKEAGYYTTNCNKEDYNIVTTSDVWNESSKTADWRTRAEGQPFFHQQQIGRTHESVLHFNKQRMESHKTVTDPSTVALDPNHPDTETFRYTNAYYHDAMLTIDNGVDTYLKQLEEEGELENTFVFYFGDHGGVLPGSKGYLNEMGLHVPLVVRIPENFKHLVDIPKGSEVDGFVSFIDFGPTLLKLAGIEVPEGMDGNPMFGEGISADDLNKRDVTFGYADRFDEKYDMVRTVRKGDLKYVRSYQPFNFDGLFNRYRYKMLAYQEWREMYDAGELNETQRRFFEPRDPEELYDVVKDPYQTVNLAKDPEYANSIKELRAELDGWLRSMPDLAFYPENYLINVAFDNTVAFGQENKEKINELIDVANLNTVPFSEADKKIDLALNSSNDWKRYWGLIVCSSFGKDASKFASKARAIAKKDRNQLVRVRAAEFLALIGEDDPNAVITDALYSSKDGVEAALILNSVVMLQDGFTRNSFNIEKSKIDETVINDKNVQIRLEYLVK